MTERVLIVGSGAREHAIAVALARSAQQPKLVCFGSARNPGIASLCDAYDIGSVTDGAAISSFAMLHSVTLAIIGPEAPLAAGVADALSAAGVPTVGPTASLARLESSKSFTRELLAKYKIPGNPVFQRFTSMDGVARTLTRFSERYVIKDDGLAGGKGVKVYGDHLHSLDESLAFCGELVDAGRAFVVEEKLEGEEFSLLSFCDGHVCQGMPLVQDHKRAYAGDSGPNTGGMGSYTDGNHLLPFLSYDDLRAAEDITRRVADALERECGHPYRGILYGGFMATRDGVRLIEYNARFGDPECLNLLTLLETDLSAICRAIVDRTLTELPIKFTSQASVCKYIVPDGYPDAARSGDAVRLPQTLPENVSVYLGAVDTRGNELVTTGARAVGVVASAATLAEAETACERVVQEVQGPFFHRADIGTAALIEKRVQHMIALRCP